MCDYNYSMKIALYPLVLLSAALFLASCSATGTESPSMTTREHYMKMLAAAAPATLQVATFGLG